MLYADGTGTVSRSAEGLGRMMTIVEGFDAFGLAVSETETETLVMHVREKQPFPSLPPSPLIIEAAGQRSSGTARRLSSGT